jgi:metal-dependent amidase/aminoacylase/carboxypeptidase family protein
MDRFAEAMIKIHHEIHNMPEIVKNAPYTAEYLTKADW